MGKTVENRRSWAESFPNHDVHGAIIVGWIVSNPDFLDSDWRMRRVGILDLTNDWRALLKMAKKQWRERKGLSFGAFDQFICNYPNLSFDAMDRLRRLLEWAKDTSQHTSRDDYEYSMSETWTRTRKNAIVEGMTQATRKMADNLDRGLEMALEAIEGAQGMAVSRTAGVQSMREIAKTTRADYGAPQGRPISTGFYRIDNSTQGGIRKSNLWMLAGGAKNGKSTVAVQLTMNVANNGGHVMWASLEMSKPELREMFVVNYSRQIDGGPISQKHVAEESLNDHERDVYFRASDKFEEDGGIGDRISIWVPDGDVNAEDVIRQAESIHRRKPIDLLVIDYSELLIPMRKRGEYRIELGDTIRRFKTGASSFAGGEGIAVLLLHQTSRKGLERALKRGYYTTQDLAESAAAERHSNVVMWVLLPEELYFEHKVRVGIMAQRKGDHSLYKGIELYCDFDRVTVGNVEQ